MAKTKVLAAPYGPDGSLLHYPRDGRKFSHYESLDGERLERSDIWKPIPVSEQTVGRFLRGPVEKQIRDDWKLIYTEPDWRPNEPFHASLQIDSMRSGRSAKYVILRPVNSPLDVRRYPMFVTDLLTVAIERGIHVGGIMHGRWMVAQRGENYGLRAAKEGE